ncbi:MAG: hypothetical protein M1828_006375 [Chrysothrix sp. TS-e1954]|nr:MAG: hypothetical protein M1828_006375 [Chrysothrix sp. TS-e1954]
MSEEFSFFQRPRKITTYGKKAAPAKKFGLFNTDTARGEILSQSPTKLQRPTSSPSKSTHANSSDSPDVVFDVPTSDGESSTTSSSRLDRSQDNPSGSLPSSELMIEHRILQDAQTLPKGDSSRKRKRHEPTEQRFSLSPSLEDLDRQAEAQIAQEMRIAAYIHVKNAAQPSHQRATEPEEELDTASPSTARHNDLAANSNRLRPPRKNPAISRGSDRAKVITGMSPKAAVIPRQGVKQAPPSVSVASVPRKRQSKSRERANKQPVPFKNRPQTPVRTSEEADVQPSTPKSQITSGSSRKVNTTPRQDKLWSSLLPAKTTATPTHGLDDLHIHPTLHIRSKAKPRLVDTLKAMSRKSDVSFAATMSRSSSPSGSEVEAMEQPGSVIAASPVKPTETACEDRTDFARSHLGYVTSRNGGPKITYGSQHETMDVEDPSSIEELLSQPEAFEVGTGAMHRAIDVECESDDEGKAIKNIHELRASGDSRKFENEVDDLVQELSVTSKAALSLRRSALIGLCRNLQDYQFKMRFIENACEHRVFAHCYSESDPVTGFAVALAVVLLLGTEHVDTCASNLYHTGVFETLTNIMPLDRDIKNIVRDRSLNMSKHAQSAAVELREQVLSLRFMDLKNQHVSLQQMSLKATELLVPRLRATGDLSRVFNSDMLSHLVRILSDTSSDQQASSVLSVLESFTVSPLCATGVWSNGVLASLVKALAQKLSSSPDTATHDQILILRLCLNTVNNSEANASAFSETSFVDKISKRIVSGFEAMGESSAIPASTGGLDALLLALGALMTLAEMSDLARQTIADLPDKTLSALTRIFVDNRILSAEAESLEQSHTNVAYGYLAVTLANMCRSPAIRSSISNALPGRRMVMLSNAVEEFIQYHKAADSREESNDIWVAFTNRLQSAADALSDADDG